MEFLVKGFPIPTHIHSLNMCGTTHNLYANAMQNSTKLRPTPGNSDCNLITATMSKHILPFHQVEAHASVSLPSGDSHPLASL